MVLSSRSLPGCRISHDSQKSNHLNVVPLLDAGAVGDIAAYTCWMAFYGRRSDAVSLQMGIRRVINERERILLPVHSSQYNDEWFILVFSVLWKKTS
jgi:hypothetical protein